MNANHIIDRLYSLRPAERLTYFEGFLDDERLKNPHGDVSHIADVAYELYKKGKLLLTQARISAPYFHGKLNWTQGVGGGFRYMATGTTPKEKIFSYNRPVEFTA